jgi:hypothetical protein
VQHATYIEDLFTLFHAIIRQTIIKNAPSFFQYPKGALNVLPNALQITEEKAAATLFVVARLSINLSIVSEDSLDEE